MGWNEKVDQLNAARTGALAFNLPHEVNDYLVPQVAKRDIPREKFKYINFQIGSNDLCWFCAQSKIGFGPGSADHFEENIRETLEALRAAIRASSLRFNRIQLALMHLSAVYSQHAGQYNRSLQDLQYIRGM